jgi:uncharacterized protein YrrD
MAKNIPLQRLIKGRDLIGLKVISLENGKLINKVDEIVYDPKENNVKALVVDQGGWFADTKIVLYQDIKSIGQDAVVIDSEDVIKKASDVQENITHIVKDDNYLTTNRVMTENGTDLGQVSDVVFDKENGHVVELEITQGTVDNIKSGKKHISVNDVIKTGEDVMIVKDSVKDQLRVQSQTGGISGIIADVKTKTPEVTETAKQKLSHLKNEGISKADDFRLKEKATETKESVLEKSMGIKGIIKDKVQTGKEKIKESRKQAAVGKYVTINILTPADEMLAPRGALITNDLLIRAQKAGVLEQVLANSSSEPIPFTGNALPQE